MGDMNMMDLRRWLDAEIDVYYLKYFKRLDEKDKIIVETLERVREVVGS